MPKSGQRYSCLQPLWVLTTDPSDPSLPPVVYEPRTDDFVKWVFCVCLHTLFGSPVSAPQRVFQRLQSCLVTHHPHNLRSLASPPPPWSPREVLVPGPQLSWHHPLVGDWCLPWRRPFCGAHIVWLCGILRSLYVASLTRGDHLHCFVPQFPHGKSIRLESALDGCWRLHWINTFRTLNIVSPDAGSMPRFVK